MSRKNEPLQTKFVGLCCEDRMTPTEAYELYAAVVLLIEQENTADTFVRCVKQLLNMYNVSSERQVDLLKLAIKMNPIMVDSLIEKAVEGMGTKTPELEVVKEITLSAARKKLKALHEDTKKPFFGVTFVKKTPPYDVREMPRAQFGVKKHLKGGERPYDPEEHDLLCVFDHDKQDYRSINMTQIISLRISGVTYKVKDGSK